MTLTEHERLVASRDAFTTARRVLETLERIPFSVVGGWALYAHGSPVPSVDLDLWIDSADHDRVYGAFLDQHDLQLDAEGVTEALNLDIEYADSLNRFFGTTAAYRRGDLATERRALLGHDVNVLTGPDLLFAKAKAFHDRSQQWALRQDATGLAALALRDPDEAAFIRSRSLAYWLRKAGKDLVDVRFAASRSRHGRSAGRPRDCGKSAGRPTRTVGRLGCRVRAPASGRGRLKDLGFNAASRAHGPQRGHGSAQ